MAALAVGVAHLDALMRPVPRHATLLYANDPGVEAEPFLYQAAHERLAAGGLVVYAVTNRSPASVLDAMRGFGFDAAPHAARLHFLDAFSALMGAPSAAERVVARPGEPLAFVEALEALAAERPGALLLIDSLSTLIDQSDEAAFAAVFPRLLAAMRRFELAEASFTRWPYSERVSALLAPFDAVVRVRGVEDRVTTGQYFAVERATWKPDVDARPRLFKALRPGGVHVYIPKVLVTGPFHAGKSSFVHAVSDNAASADELGTTVALDHGRATLNGLTADVFGTPGQARFDPILALLAGQALGVIVVVDSTKPESFPRAREMLLQTWRQGLPGIIAANKQDIPGALSADEIARLLQPPPRVRVIPCEGQERESARRVLQQLLDQILSTAAEEVVP